MKKLFCFLLTTGLFLSTGWAEKSVDIYKTGIVKIKNDPSYQPALQWLEGDDDLDHFAGLVLDEQNNVYILDREKLNIIKLDAGGQLAGEFSIKSEKSTSVYDKINELAILDNKYLLVRGYSFIRIFNLDGEHIKDIEFDFPLYDMTALRENKIACRGCIMLKDQKTKWHIFIDDILSETRTPVVDFYEDQSKRKETVQFKSKLGLLTFSNYSAKSPDIYMQHTTDGHLIVGQSNQPDLYIYDINGTQKAKIALNYNRLEIDPLETEKFYQFLKEKMTTLGAPDSAFKVLESKDFYYQYMPYYYDIKTDSEGHILVFKHTQEEDHIFRVYQVFSKEGQFICETKMDAGGFESPKLRLLQFFHGDIYALLANPSETPKIQLVKSPVVNQ
ncbi:hypothetical protein JW935_19645 [candidate division KSB1 bacterium]|nr:hypothetical protein [candidate division KSB1 bacterium]